MAEKNFHRSLGRGGGLGPTNLIEVKFKTLSGEKDKRNDQLEVEDDINSEKSNLKRKQEEKKKMF